MCLILWQCLSVIIPLMSSPSWSDIGISLWCAVGISWWTWSCWPSRTYRSPWTSWPSRTPRTRWRERRTGKTYHIYWLARHTDRVWVTKWCFIMKKIGRERTSGPSWKRRYSGTCGSARTWRTSWTTWRRWRQGNLLLCFAVQVREI